MNAKANSKLTVALIPLIERERCAEMPTLEFVQKLLKCIYACVEGFVWCKKNHSLSSEDFELQSQQRQSQPKKAELELELVWLGGRDGILSLSCQSQRH